MPHSEFDRRDDYHEDDEFEHGENPEDDEPEDDEPEDDEPEDNELEDDEPEGGESSDEEENPGKGKTNTSDRRRFHIDEDSPPLSNLNDIYADLVRRGLELGLEEFLASLGNGTFVVATMCSGTESPILALQMIDDSMIEWLQPL